MRSDPTETGDASRQVASRAFGAENRSRLLNRYFNTFPHVDESNAWLHIYRLLLWIDRTTALAHCYESDKAQPGRAWYARSLAFHKWFSEALTVTPATLGEHIDWLFREAVKDVARRVVGPESAGFIAQRQPYIGQGFPEPGEDPELVALVKDTLKDWLDAATPDTALQQLTKNIYAYMTQENKRRNLVGEGFEDVIAALIRRLSTADKLAVKNRTLLHDLPGFRPPPVNEKPKRVDVAILSETKRVLVSAKWSVRADREEQFQSDFEAYARLESAGSDFDYVLITNEFDAARLRAACERRRQNAPLFTAVVHINPEGVLAAYGDSERGSSNHLRAHIADGRLTSLEKWLQSLT